MAEKRSDTLVQTAILGAIAGVRSMSAPALLARYAARHPGPFKRPPTRWLISDAAQRIIPFLAVGEMIADKLPILPKRKDPAPLIGRIFWGGLVGGSLMYSRRESAALGALVGGASAAVSTFVTYYIRIWLNKGLGLPSPVAGLVEDAFILAAGPRILGD